MKAVFFPPGDIPCDEEVREACFWRELAFATHLVRQAVNPSLNLTDCIQKWGAIARDLAEPPRERSYQMNKIGLAI
jgi:hypothetical protein